MLDKTVEVIGVGYVGLPLALLLAKNGVKVIGFDVNEKLVANINNGNHSIGEKEIDDLLKDKEVMENFRATTVIEKADIFAIAVPTPVLDRKKIADLSYVVSAVDNVIKVLEKGNLIIVESTIPPLTCRDLVAKRIEKKTNFKVNEDVYISHCPERILPGDIYNELINNSRIVGGMNEIASEMSAELYRTFVKGDILITDDITAELAKLVENAYRDVNIAFANEIHQVAEGLKIDPFRLIELANHHPRVNILQPGIGVGGHCIAVDPWFIKEVDLSNSSLIQTARLVNDNRPKFMVEKIRKIISTDIKNHKEINLILLGAAYKPNSSDLRESPALDIYHMLQDEGFNVKMYDPLIPDFAYNKLEDVISDEDRIFVLVKHDRIQKDLDDLKEKIPTLSVTYLP